MTASHKKSVTSYTLVVGLGVTGMSVVRYLRALDENVVVVDSRDLPPGKKELIENFPEVSLHTGGFDEKLFTEAHRVVVSPGVSLNLPAIQQARDKGVEITGDIDLFAHEAAAPVIGITGSNGKSTVTMLLSAMAMADDKAVATGGNIGTPALDLLSDEADLFVLELSSFQLEGMSQLQLEAAVVLNISSDHMDRYADLASYAASKQVAYQNARSLVVNRDDELVSNMLLPRDKIIGFTLGEPSQQDFGVFNSEDERWLCRGKEKLLSISDLKIKGNHNIANALAALALGELAGLNMSAMLTALKTYPGLEHRTQWLGCFNDVNWYNDSKATNVGASVAAITGLSGKHVLIAGGDGKQADFSVLKSVAKQHLRAVVLMGRDAGLIEETLGGVVPCVHAGDMTEAVQRADELAQAGDNVLLSPACASLDMYRNFEHRGEVFVQAVQEQCK